MTDRLNEIRARAEAATPGEWAARKDQFIEWFGIVALNDEHWSTVTTWPVLSGDNDYGPAGGITNAADATFIAHAREDIPYLLAEVERLREELDDATGGFVTATPTAMERITSLKTEVERLRAALDTEKEANVSESVCLCGHRKIDHIYEEGACRPGHVCALSCDEFTPVVGSAITEGGES